MTGVLRAFLIAVVLSFARPLPASGSIDHLIEGRVTDSASGETIAAVNIRILGTARGTVSNADGRYRLPLEPGRHIVVFSHLAYVADTLVIDPVDLLTTIDIALQPTTLLYPEVLVLAEDPALEIIRKAIANKHAWMDRLKSYRFEAYTRQVIDRDTSVASIAEAFTVGWVLSGDTLRERVIRKRQTANIPMEENFAAVRRLVNFNDDRISLFTIRLGSERRSYIFVGPTAPDALDNYDYRLLRTRRSGGIEMYEIEMSPKTMLKPLFRGVITIADRSFAVVGVDLVPNETFNFPFLKEINLRYRQQFALYDSLFWMPADVRIEGGFNVSFAGFGIPRVGFNQISSIYNYELNVPVPDSVLHQGTVTTDSLAGVYDSTVWNANLVVPLTTEESSAYRTLDSTETLEEQFKPEGVLGSLGGRGSKGAGSLLGMVDIRYTRVEGFYLGGSKEIRVPGSNAVIGMEGGYGFSDKRGQYAGTFSIQPSARAGGFGFGISAFNHSERVTSVEYYGPIVNSLTSLINKNDAPDYFRALGWTTWADISTGRRFSARFTFVSQKESPMSVTTGYSFFSGDRPFRPNPQAIAGNRRSLGITARFGRRREEFDIVTPTNFEISVEHSSPSIFNSAFDYTRIASTLTWAAPTFAKDLLFAPMLRIRIFSGKGFGSLPPQRAFSADTRSGILGPFGTLRAGTPGGVAGDAMVSVTAEHNFRSLPFLLLNLPFLYENGVELLVHGAVARAWNSPTRVSGGAAGWHREVGIGVNRILDLVRFDLTYRLSEPRRLYFTLGVSTLL